jgi:TorA maturation chaperone TorD
MSATVSQSASDTRAATGWQAQAVHARVQTYRLLAHLLQHAPSADLLDRLARPGRPLPEAGESDAGEPDLARAWRHLSEAAQVSDPAAVDDAFHALFIGVGRGEVLPYASWYLAGALMDRPLVAVRSDLARLGIARNDDTHEPEDHAAALFEVMALLADPDEGVSAAEQRHFLLMHIAPWAGRMFTDIEHATSADDFYRAAAMLGAAFIDAEQSWLSLPE